MAARDTNPNTKVPEGPSANQDATRNQKDFIGRLGKDAELTSSTTKGEASAIISDGLNSNGNQQNSSGGAAPDNNPGNPVPSGPSAKQPATRNQKGLVDSLGATDQLSENATKGEASDIISKNQS